MVGQIFGYARCFAGDDEQTQHGRLVALGVPEEQVFLDIGYTAHTERPALDRAVASCCAGDALVAASLDRLAWSMRDLSEIANALADRGASIAFDGLLFDLATPIGQVMLTLTSRFAKFESDHFRSRTVEGMARARRAGGRRPGKPLRLSADQRRELLSDHESHNFSVRELMTKYGVARSAIYDLLKREREARAAQSSTGSAEHQDTTM